MDKKRKSCPSVFCKDTWTENEIHSFECCEVEDFLINPWPNASIHGSWEQLNRAQIPKHSPCTEKTQAKRSLPIHGQQSFLPEKDPISTHLQSHSQEFRHPLASSGAPVTESTSNVQEKLSKEREAKRLQSHPPVPDTLIMNPGDPSCNPDSLYKSMPWALRAVGGSHICLEQVWEGFGYHR